MTAKYLPNIVPGDFTGVYTSKVKQYLPQQQSTAQVNSVLPVFRETLKNISEQIAVSKPIRNSVQNIGNYLPFTALIGSDVGPYGLIFANPVLRLCQYYKKASPSVRF